MSAKKATDARVLRLGWWLASEVKNLLATPTLEQFTSQRERVLDRLTEDTDLLPKKTQRALAARAKAKGAKR